MLEKLNWEIERLAGSIMIVGHGLKCTAAECTIRRPARACRAWVAYGELTG